MRFIRPGKSIRSEVDCKLSGLRSDYFTGQFTSGKYKMGGQLPTQVLADHLTHSQLTRGGRLCPPPHTHIAACPTSLDIFLRHRA